MKTEHMIVLAFGAIGAGALVYYLLTHPQGQQAVAPIAGPQQMQPDESGLVTRGLLPQDLGITDFNLTAGGAGWTNMATATVPRGVRSIKFTGLSYGGTQASQIRITAGTSVREIWPIKFISGLQSQIWYDPSPSVALENQPIVIDVYFDAAATETFNLMGEVKEIRGRTVA